MRLVYYSLASVPGENREQQWIQSIRSLRTYNRSIPVWLLLFNGASRDLLREAGRQDVRVQSLGDYGEFLQRAHARGPILSLYPTLHKFLSFANLPLEDVSQILYLDCDTFFFEDVAVLFDQYSGHDWYAREEPRTLRSPHARNPKHVDEMLLRYIAHKEGLHCVPPFNSGVCLLNHGIWQSVTGLRESYLDMVWRLLCGRELSGHVHESDDPRVRSAVLNAVTDADRASALPYPSANPWIIEQIALWLTLGQLPHFSLGTLSAAQVPQGGEVKEMLESQQRCVVAHYFSGGEEQFFSSVPAIVA